MKPVFRAKAPTWPPLPLFYCNGGIIMDTTMIIDTFWVLLAAILVFFMNL